MSKITIIIMIVSNIVLLLVETLHIISLTCKIDIIRDELGGTAGPISAIPAVLICGGFIIFIIFCCLIDEEEDEW